MERAMTFPSTSTALSKILTLFLVENLLFEVTAHASHVILHSPDCWNTWGSGVILLTFQERKPRPENQ